MIKLLLKKLKSQYGAIDKIFVTLLFVIIGVASLVALEQWFQSQRNNLVNSSENAINIVKNESGNY